MWLSGSHTGERQSPAARPAPVFIGSSTGEVIMRSFEWIALSFVLAAGALTGCTAQTSDGSGDDVSVGQAADQEQVGEGAAACDTDTPCNCNAQNTAAPPP